MNDQDDPLCDLNDLCYELARWVDATAPGLSRDVDSVHINKLLDDAYESLDKARDAAGDIQ